MSNIIISGAREGNLKNITLEIPRNKLVIFTGLSGSGKSTLLVDVLYMECQRQFLEAISYQGIRKPLVDHIRNVSPAIMITQTDANKNPRSTVGTVTNIYTDLRMIFEKLSIRTCPHCKERISAADCTEETEKIDDKFKVYMHCNKCGKKMDKLTRTEFSFNTREGACPKCEGFGKVLTINKENVINEALSLEDGAVFLWGQKHFNDYQISVLYNSYRHFGIPIPANMSVDKYSDLQKAILYEGVECSIIKTTFPDISLPKAVMDGRFEGIYPMLWRRISDKGGEAKQLDEYFDSDTCPECHGERLFKDSRNATVAGVRLPELSVMSLEEIYEWINKLDNTLSSQERSFVCDYILDIKTKIKRILNVGLSYLSLDRQTVTLSGGELQRIRLAATLDSDLTGVIYVIDEPTIGLHPNDTLGMIKILKRLRDLGNTVLVIEHDTDMMKAADYIIDIGPGSGKHGGEIIGTGTLDELLKQEKSVTGSYLVNEQVCEGVVRQGNNSVIKIRNAYMHNLKNIDADFPIGCLTTVTGVSGSGKSTLIFDVLGNMENMAYKTKISQSMTGNTKGSLTIAKDTIITGIDKFDQIITIEQAPITKMKRSNIATYSEAYSEIRNIFAQLKESSQKGLTSKHFSFNTKGGRCENCEGLGYIESNMLFFTNIEVTCPVCGGNQFNDTVLSVKYKGNSIKDILKMPVEDALLVFDEHLKVKKILQLLLDVGLGYLELGQSLTTLSGGEGQRLKLARELIISKGKHNLYLMDEPTTGLHPLDVKNFLVLLNRIVDSGNTVIVVEHNQQVIKASDWIVDLGPEGGIKGGEIIFTGTPKQMIEEGTTVTAHMLRK